MYFPKVLVISNNGFSEVSNNGRTLGNLFVGWPIDCIAQFCISIKNPNFTICNNYFIITDKEVISSFLKFRKAKRVDVQDAINTEGASIKKSNGEVVKKTALLLLLRHFLWINKWNSLDLLTWVDSFRPDIILCNNSDSAFILNIARKLSNKLDIPLVMFNTEAYYLFTKNYLRKRYYLDDVCFIIYRKIYRAYYKMFMKRVSHVIYLNSKLQEDYSKIFNHKSSVIYTSSSLKFHENNNILPYRFTYLGNLGYDRWKALIQIGKVLQDINSSFKLEVYGSATKEILDKFNSEESIIYKGFIDYNEVKNIILSSTITFHAELINSNFSEELKYGFSTKIADSISSGHCFIMFAPTDFAGSKYIIENRCGWCVDNIKDLKNVINIALFDLVKRDTVLHNAKIVADKNHNIEINRNKLHNILLNEL